MEEYIKWLENKIEVCLEDKDLQREHWAFCQALKKYRELALYQLPVSSESVGFKNEITMKQSNLSFADGFLGIEAKIAKEKGNTYKAFDWDKAAEIIKEKLKLHPDLKAEAGLQGDWNYTGGVIFENGKPTNDEYTYLQSNWAKPTLILEWDGEEQEELECSTDANERFSSDTKWDEKSLAILGIGL